MALIKEKACLRTYFKNLRGSLSEEEQLEKSEKICQIFLHSPFYFKAKRIALFCPFNKEVNIYPILDKALEEKEIYLPITHIKEKKLTFHRIFSLKELKKSALGIYEPPFINPSLSPSNLDLILVPGLAFDKRGGRLGYGGGFYDRVLGQTKAFKIGIAFSFQVVESLLLEPWDQKVDFILTEEGFLSIILTS